MDPKILKLKQQNEFQKLYQKAQEKRKLFFKNLQWPYFQIKLCLKNPVLSEDVKKVPKNFIAETQYLPKALALEIKISSEALMGKNLLMLMVKLDLYKRDTYATQSVRHTNCSV